MITAHLPATLVVAIALLLTPTEQHVQANDLPGLTEVQVTSSLDGVQQPVLYWAPATARRQPTTLFIFLHSWSSDYRQNNTKWQQVAVDHGWIYLHPNFRGINKSPQACGSKFARQDVLDAVDFALQEFHVDTQRIFLCGVSGGGHMSMLMAGHHPDRFTAVSAWVGISDIAEWYRFHTRNGQTSRYSKMMLQSFKSPPGTSANVDADYRDRSPLFHIHRVGNLSIDIFAGVNDGHSGSVPVSQSLRAFNAIANSHNDRVITDAEMEQLWEDRKLTNPLESDRTEDAVLGRKILLRRTSGNARVTIFAGGHESIPAAAVAGLLRHAE